LHIINPLGNFVENVDDLGEFYGKNEKMLKVLEKLVEISQGIEEKACTILYYREMNKVDKKDSRNSTFYYVCMK